ncbi:hypothetical protein OC861_005499 [Tilletia horrida]|nr:hypothetical protein OC861_005499 [Tilletia horrida]
MDDNSTASSHALPPPPPPPPPPGASEHTAPSDLNSIDAAGEHSQHRNSSSSLASAASASASASATAVAAAAAAAAAASIYSHPSIPSMLSTLGPPGTMHSANGAPLPPYMPEGSPGSGWYGVPARSPSAQYSLPPLVASIVNASNSRDQSSSQADSQGSTPTTAGGNPQGPPFVCSACKQTYSRLEYLRRHERRHADIRPFVCECGKGFSRSDVLARHKKQCKTLSGEDGAKTDRSPSNDGDTGGEDPPSKRRRRSGSTSGPSKRKKSSSADVQPSGQNGGPGGSSLQHQSMDSSMSGTLSGAGCSSMLDPALSAMSQSALIESDMSQPGSMSHSSSSVNLFTSQGSAAYAPETTMAYPFPSTTGQAPAYSTQVDVANAASVALAELAAAATMLPSDNSALQGFNMQMQNGNTSSTSSYSPPNSYNSGSISNSPSNGSGRTDDGKETSPTPEQALLRVTGGSQELRLGVRHPTSVYQTLTGFGGGDTRALAPGIGGASNFGMVGPSTSLSMSNSSSSVISGHSNSLDWVLSPSIQQLLAWANASSGGPAAAGVDRTAPGFSYFSQIPGMTGTSAAASLGEDLAVVSTLDPFITDIQNAFSSGVNAPAAATSNALASHNNLQAASLDGRGDHEVDYSNTFGGAGSGGLVSGAANLIMNGLAAEAQPGFATTLANLKRNQSDFDTVVSGATGGSDDAARVRTTFNEILAMDLQKAFTDARNPFFIPQHLFRACYSIPHWDLPPLTRLSMLAFHSQKNLLKQFPFLHEPTFRVDTTPGCLAFATCMLGSSDTGRRWWIGEDVLPPPDRAHIIDDPANEGRTYDEEDGQVLVRPIVMDEKMDMLLRVFAYRCKSQFDRVAAVQCLSLAAWKELLEPDTTRRAHAALTQQKVTAYARKSGFFSENAEWVDRSVHYTASQVLDTMLSEAAELVFSYSFLPTYLPGCPDEEKVWRRWCDFEGRRRTSFILFVVDTISHLDTGATMVVSSADIAHLPLPTPDAIWRATTPEAWLAALQKYRGPTVGDSLLQLMASGDEEIPPPVSGNLPSIVGSHGPFARLIMMFALLRGILVLMDGKVNQVARLNPLAKYFRGPLAADGGRSELVVFKHALARWRKAWDSDATCAGVGWVQRWNEPAAKNGDAMQEDDADSSLGGGPSSVFTSRTSHGATPLCDDALPFYWLGHVLLDHVTRGRKLPQRPASSLLAAGKENVSNKTKAKLSTAPINVNGFVPDYRVLLKLAKEYVSEGAKGNPVDWPPIPLEFFSSAN